MKQYPLTSNISPSGPSERTQVRKPFWLPALNYYLFSLGIVVALFFLLWGILHDGGDETPIIASAIGASITGIFAIMFREIFLRRSRNRYLQIQRKFDRQVDGVYARIGKGRRTEKLTVDQNAAILKEIAKKSKAANILAKFSGGHFEVFEMCSNYLERIDQELRSIGVGSPRLVPLNRSRLRVIDIHRYHLLQWAEIEARELSLQAKGHSELTERVRSAQHAIDVIDTALKYYPDERALIESRMVLLELLSSIQISDLIERAKHLAYEGDHSAARNLYRDGLYLLGRDNVEHENRSSIAAYIKNEIERLDQQKSTD